MNKTDTMNQRSISDIANDIEVEWTRSSKNGVNYAARPYLDAMHSLRNINDMYMLDTAQSVVLYFLSNANSFRGEAAKELKKELKALMK